MDGKEGNQTIGCEVTSCRFNSQGNSCNLHSIQVKPACDCHSGGVEEANCGSYVAK